MLAASTSLPTPTAPPFTLRPFAGPHTTIETMVEMVKGPRGERSMVLYKLTEHVVRWLQPKDYHSEILAIRNFAAEKIRYKNDPLTTEAVSDPQRLAEEILRYGRAVGDCDDVAAFIAAMSRQLGREAQFVTVGFGRAGSYSHVFARVKDPKGPWIVTDPIAGTNERRMLRRVTTYKIWRID